MITLSHYFYNQNDRFYVPRTHIKAARFDFQPGDNGESDLSKPRRSLFFFFLKQRNNRERWTQGSTVAQQVTVTLLLWLAMLIAIRVALSPDPQRLSRWRVYWLETSIFAIRILEADGFHHILRTDLVDYHCFRQSGRLLFEMLFRVCKYENIDLRTLPNHFKTHT